MATIIFYEKPGCNNNRRQKVLLAAAGHKIIARSLLTEPWTAARLCEFFGNRPVAEWFNRAAPKIKSGEIVPEYLDAETALKMMLQEPLLIRRPLLETAERKEVGFDDAEIQAWLELAPSASNLEQCTRAAHIAPCTNTVI